jgi:hypothetical protein
MPSSYSTPEPETPRRPRISTTALADQLWKNVLMPAESIGIDTDSEQELRVIVAQGAERMTLENRVSPNDIALAERNLGRFVGLMKHSAELLGHPDSLGRDTLIAADQALVVLAFRPWPFKFGKPYEQYG